MPEAVTMGIFAKIVTREVVVHYFVKWGVGNVIMTFQLLIDIRAVEKINYPNLLVSWPVFRVAVISEYFNMRPLTRLESGSISGAI